MCRPTASCWARRIPFPGLRRVGPRCREWALRHRAPVSVRVERTEAGGGPQTNPSVDVPSSSRPSLVPVTSRPRSGSPDVSRLPTRSWPCAIGRACRSALTAGLTALTACHPPIHVASTATESGWVGTWATSQQIVEPGNMPPAPGLSGNTLRQVVHVSLGGTQIRTRFSNVFGDGPMTIAAAAIAPSLGESRIDSASQRALTFGGNASVVVAAGRDTISDVVAFGLAPLSNVAITARFGNVPAVVTGHPGSRTTSYLQPGDAVAAPSLPTAVKTVHWYVAASIDVAAPRPSAAVVTLGNSITDGRGSGTDKQNRWPDEIGRAHV